MSRKALAILILALVAVSTAQVSNNSSLTTTQIPAQKTPLTPAPPDVRTLQHLYAPYWTTEGNWHTTIHLRNNIPDESLSVTPILHAASGEVLTLESVTVPGNQIVPVDVNAAMSAALSKSATAVAEPYGYLELQYMAYDLQNLFAPVMLHLMGAPVNFHIDPKPNFAKSRSGVFDGFWWNRHTGLEDVLVLTNKGSKPNNTRLVLSDSSGKQVIRSYPLAPNSMVRLSVLDLLRDAGFTSEFGSIHIDPAVSGSFDAVHFVYDTSKGFSALMKMFERIPGLDLHSERRWGRDAGWTLWAPMLALATPDPGLWFPSETILKPYVFVQNLSPRPVSAR